MICEINVTDEIKKQADRIASIRVGCKTEAVKTQWEYNWFGTPEEHHFVGAVGELCYAKARFGKAFTDETARPGGDGQDFITLTGRSIDVKTSTWGGSDVHLKVSKREFAKKPKDFYVLVQYLKDEDKAIIVGYASRDEVAKGKTINYGYEDNFTIAAKKLRHSYYVKGTKND